MIAFLASIKSSRRLVGRPGLLHGPICINFLVTFGAQSLGRRELLATFIKNGNFLLFVLGHGDYHWFPQLAGGVAFPTEQLLAVNKVLYNHHVFTSATEFHYKLL